MKRVFIIHGWGGSPEEAMHRWLKEELIKKKFNVVVPLMPNPDQPEIKNWIPHLKK